MHKFSRFSKFSGIALSLLIATFCLTSFKAQASDDSDFEFTGIIETLPNTSGFIGDWKVAGRTIHVTASTELKQSDGAFAVGKTVKVEGIKQNDNSVNAKKIETKSGSSNGDSSFKFYGVIEELPNTTGRIGDWKVTGRVVHVSTTTVIRQEDGPVAVGAKVEVEGSQRTDGSVDASEIHTEDESGNSGSFEFYGTIESLPSTTGRIGEWAISGRKVNVTAATRIKQEKGAVAVGVIVEVKGTVKTDGSVDATDIETKSGPANPGGGGNRVSEFHGTIETLPGTTGQIGLWTVSGRKVNVVASTVIEHAALGIAVGKRVEVKGVPQTDGSINATKIEIEEGAGSTSPSILFGKIETLPTVTTLIGDWKVAAKTVHVTAATIIERKYGTVAVGAFVEVYGTAQADGSINATKIEVKQGPGNGGFMYYNSVATVSSASYREDNSPESIVSAFGSGLSSTTAIASTQPLPLSLSDVSVLVDGRQARLFFVSPNQINYQIPSDAPSGLANVVVSKSGEVVSQGTILVSNVALSLFTADASGQGAPAGLLLRIKANGEQVYESLVRFDAAQNKLVPAAIVRRAGEQLYLILFGSGLRNAPNSDNNTANGVAESVEVTIGGVNAPVIYAGVAPGYVGLEQINIRIPDNAASNPNSAVTVKVRDVLNNLKQANTVTISIQ
ncbi:MAG: hypothetical protein KA368_06040 [Acidobacteria bacterium]|nr:hypothetical protein [Acidobacteriota bacterium]